MASYTPNIGLHQWVAGDKFLRTDFNTDFQKIDTAMGQKASTSSVSSLKSQVSSIQTAVSGKSEFVLGSYTGNGTADRAIPLGFQPSLVLISGGNYNTMVDQAGSALVKITSSGFTVTHNAAYGTMTPNLNNYRFCYAALR